MEAKRRAPCSDTASGSPPTSNVIVGAKWASMQRLVVAVASPRAAFREAMATGNGYGSLFWWLALEFLLIDMHRVVVALVRFPHEPIAALTGLWSRYLSYAVVPALVVLAGGAFLRFSLRSDPRRRLDAWAAASVVACAWAPHVLVVAVSVIVHGLGFDHFTLPQHRYAHLELSAAAVFLKILFEFGPSVALLGFGLRQVWCRGTSDGADSVAEANVFADRVWARVAAIVCLAAAGGASGYRVAEHWESRRPLLPGDAIPSVDLLGVDGSRVSTDALRDHVVLIEFWATWCGACVAAMPEVHALHSELHGSGLRILSLNTESESPEAVRAFVRQRSPSYPVFFADPATVSRFGVDSLPAFFLVDRYGVIRGARTGASAPTDLRPQIDELLQPPRR